MIKLRAAAGLAVLSLTLGLVALPALGDERDSFRAADANGDGQVTFQEARGIYPTLPQILFNQADDNKDGVLDEGEYGELQGLTAGFPVGG